MKQILWDSWFLAGVWLSVLGMLAYDALAEPEKTVRIAAMCWLVFFTVIGLAWRRYWKRMDARQANAEMCDHINREINRSLEK